MKKTLKNFLATELNANVEAKKISYNKNNITRTYIITDADGIYADEVENVIPLGIDDNVFVAPVTSTAVKVKVTLPASTDWRKWEEEVLNDWEPKEEESQGDDEALDLVETPDIEETINNLKVGPCYIPGVGAGYTSNEEDLEKLKQFLRGAMTMAGMMGKM